MYYLAENNWEEAALIINLHYSSLKDRPEWDGYYTLSEAIEWYSHLIKGDDDNYKSHRLTNIEIDGNESHNIIYDNLGNISFKYDAGSMIYNSTNPYTVRMITDVSDITSFGGSQDVTYTSFDKVKSISQDNKNLHISYGADRQRVRQTLNVGEVSKTKRYFTPRYETISTGGTTKKIHYLTSSTGLFAIFALDSNNSGTMSYVIKDHQGSLNATVTGGAVSHYGFDAWGRRRDPQTLSYDNVSTSIDRGYTLHEHYDEFGLINMNGRLYDPLVGRMLSPDIVIQDEQNSQAYNRYSYCFNNPLRFTDPSGYVVRGFYSFLNWSSTMYYDTRIFSNNGSSFNTDLSEGKATPVNDNYTVDDEGYIKLVEKTIDDFDVIYTKDCWDKGEKDNYIIVDKNILGKKKTNSAVGVNGKKYSFDMYSVNDDITSIDLFEFLTTNTKVEWSQTFIGLNNSGKSIISTSHIRNAEAGQGYLLSNGWTIRGHNHSHPFSMNPSQSDINWANSVQTKFPNVKLQIFFKGEYFEYDMNGIINLPFSNISEIIIKPED